MKEEKPEGRAVVWEPNGQEDSIKKTKVSGNKDKWGTYMEKTQIWQKRQSEGTQVNYGNISTYSYNFYLGKN